MIADGASVEPAAGADSVLRQVVLEPTEIVGDTPQFVRGTVQLGGPAPAGGAEVQLFTDRPDILTLPSAAGIPEGDAAAPFVASLAGVKQTVAVLVTAKQGVISRWAVLLVHGPGEVIAAASANGTAADETAPPPLADEPAPDNQLTSTPSAAAAPVSNFMALAQAAAAALDPPWSPTAKQSFRGALLGVVPSVPFLAVVAMLAIYAAPAGTALGQFDPWLAGTIFAVGIGLLATLARWLIIQDTSAEGANSTSFDEIRERLAAITARLSLAAERIDDDEGNQMALREVQAWRAQILAELATHGPEWVLGTAYVNVWKLVHRAEEALLALLPIPNLMSEALFDEQRLASSEMGERDELLTRLRLAVAGLDQSGAKYLSQQPAVPAVQTVVSPPDPMAPRVARGVLREIRLTIDDFRDQKWGNIVRARNHLLRTLTITGLVTYLGTLLALDLSPKPTPFDPRTDAMIAAAVFYLVGALVGLFNRLSSESNTGADMEDYGLTEARLALTPVLSGLAAIGGVYATAMLTGTLTGVVGGAGASGTALSLPSIGAVMNLSSNPFAVLVAAVFGLSPATLISSLQAQADKYKGALQSTAAHT